MEESIPYPFISPDTFDLIVVGTGLVESIIATAASVNGRSVLHVDSNPFYGSHISSRPLDSFATCLESKHLTLSSTHECSSPTHPDHDALLLTKQHLFSNFDECRYSAEDLKPSSKFCLDLTGPKLVYCMDPLVDEILKSGANHHLNFMAIEGSYIYMEGKLSPVPDSRGGIFKDRSLGLTEKTQMMKFFNLVQRHFESNGDHNSMISKDDLESPFVEFLSKQNLPQKIKSIVLYTIAMADYDQYNSDSSKNLVKTKDGLESLALYLGSLGRFANTPGAFIYPKFGQGDFSEAFCRCAAVKGVIHVLRMPLCAMLINKKNGCYEGIQLASGQNIFSKHVVLDPSVAIPAPISYPSSGLELGDLECLLSASPDNTGVGKVARGVCITKTLNAEQKATVRALQLNSDLAVCPPGLFILYFSTLCDDAILGKELIKQAIDALCVIPTSEGSEKFEEVRHWEGEMKPKPVLLWSATYVQECKQGGSFDTIFSCPMPDGNIDYKESLKFAKETFQKLYSLDILFPEPAGGSGDSEKEKV